MGSVWVRDMDPVDLEFAAALHSRLFPDGFFARLGPAFLVRYYRSFLDSSSAVALVAEHDGVRCAYLVGMLDPGAHRSEVLRRHGPQLAWVALAALSVRPGLAAEFVRTRLRRYGRALLRQLRPASAPAGASGPAAPAVLSHVAVLESSRASGVGTVLVDAFVAAARSAGRESVCLVTRSGEEGAGSFYTRLGWTSSGTRRTDDGQSLDYYTLRLQEDG